MPSGCLAPLSAIIIRGSQYSNLIFNIFINVVIYLFEREYNYNIVSVNYLSKVIKAYILKQTIKQNRFPPLKNGDKSYM